MARPATMPNPENCTLEELQVAAKCAPTRNAFVRLTCIRVLIMGLSLQDVAAIHLKSRRTVQNWIRLFNEQGINGLIDKPRSGCPRKIPPEQAEQCRNLIKAPAEAGQTHWTAKKFHGYLRDTLQLEVGYRTVVRWMHEQKFCLKVPRPWPNWQDEELRDVFRERLREWLGDSTIDLWYLDEVGVEGDPRPRRRWAEKGEKARITRNGGHLRMNATGMICPRSGQFYALEFSHSDREMFQTFLDYANEDVTLERRRNLLICDNASWHKCKCIDWGTFEPIFLPPYSPDLNPIERLWLLMKAEWFSDFIAKDRQHLMERLDHALCWLMDRNEGNQTTCAIRK